MQWITDVAVPIALGLLAAFGATWFSNRKNTERLEREADDRAADTIRAYIRVLRETSDYLEARAIGGGGWDPTEELINHGGHAAVLAAYNTASPFFHRMDVRETDNKPLQNSFPYYGDGAMDGAGNFQIRAQQVQAVLDRGLKNRMPARRSRRT